MRRAVGAKVASGCTVRHDVQADDPTGATTYAQRVIRGDLDEPRPQCPLVADGAATLEGGQKGLDDDVLGIRPVTHDQVGDGMQLPTVDLEQIAQGFGSSPP